MKKEPSFNLILGFVYGNILIYFTLVLHSANIVRGLFIAARISFLFYFDKKNVLHAKKTYESIVLGRFLPQFVMQKHISLVDKSSENCLLTITP